MEYFDDIFSYQKGLEILFTYLQLDQVNYNKLDNIYNQTERLIIANDFLFCIKDKHFFKVVEKYNIHEWYLHNNIDMFLDEILEFIITLKNKIVSNYYIL
jgi:hypothetical protein